MFIETCFAAYMPVHHMYAVPSEARRGQYILCNPRELSPAMGILGLEPSERAYS